MYDIDAMLNAICERVGVTMESAEKLAARDTYEAQLVLDRKAALARSCGNCTKSHDLNAPSDQVCEYIVQKRLAEIYLRLARLNAPMGVMPCTKCQGAAVIGLGAQAPCDACDGRGWWYMKGDTRATEATVQPDVLPAAAPIPKPQLIERQSRPRRDNRPDIVKPHRGNARPRRKRKGPMANRHDGVCHKCSNGVPATQGWITRNTEDTKWLVWCQHCFTKQ